jgi:hypothetical protein
MRRIALALIAALSITLGAAAADAKQPQTRIATYEVTRAEGTVKINFHGGEAAGCRTRGVCGLSGSTTYSFGGRPRYGQVIWARQRKRTVGFFGYAVTRGETASDVVSAGSDEHCIDRSTHENEQLAFEPRSRSIRFSWRELVSDDEEFVFVGGENDDPFDTRCAGPHLVDLDPSHAIPFADVSYRVFRSPKSSFTTTGSRPFAGGGFAGTVEWQLSYGFRFRGTNSGGGWSAVPIR